MHVVGGRGQKPIDFQRCHFHNGRLPSILDFSVFWHHLCLWEEANWFSAMSLSKWLPGGHIGFFGFRTLTSVCLWISSPNFSSTLLVSMERSPLIFRYMTFKMAAWWPYWIFWFLDSKVLLWISNLNSAAHFLHVLVNRRLLILKDVQLQSMYCQLIPISAGRGYPSRSLIYSF